MWLLKSAVEVSRDRLIIRRGLFDGRFKQVDASEVTALKLTSSMSSGETKYYDIVASTKSGKKLKLADHLLGKRDVESLIERMRGELGLAN